MQHHNKSYENVFSTDKPKGSGRGNRTFHLDKISIDGMSLDEYLLLSKNFMSEFYASIFDSSVRYAWLRRKFAYGNEKATPQMRKNSIQFCSAFMKFSRRHIGMDPQLITRSRFFQCVEPYFDTLFPGFDEGNPFDNPEYYKFPFKNISIDFLMTVYQLEERIDLLKVADERMMSYAVFADYVINHILSVNQGLDRERYKIIFNRNRRLLFYIEDLDNKLETKFKK